MPGNRPRSTGHPLLHALRIKGVLLTVLMLLGVLLALMLMFAAGPRDPKAEPAANPPPRRLIRQDPPLTQQKGRCFLPQR